MIDKYYGYSICVEFFSDDMKIWILCLPIHTDYSDEITQPAQNTCRNTYVKIIKYLFLEDRVYTN